MNLVAYSDSEASDEESPQTQAPAQKSVTAPSKPSFQKVVDRSNPHKIRVNLPSTVSDNAEENQEEEERPAKRARVGGGGLFSGLNSFLPAPKRSGEAAGRDATQSGSVVSRGLGKGLGRGVSLKTGAAPAFSREQPSMMEDYSVDAAGDSSTGNPKLDSPRIEEAEVKLVGKSTIFRPLSVARNTGKKKKKSTTTAISSAKTTDTIPTTMSGQPSAVAPPPKQKVSLFSMSREDDLPTVLPDPSYSTLETADENHLVEDEEEPEARQDQPDYYKQAAPNPIAGTQSLDSLASDLDLDENTRRQLFGRRSKAADAPINLVSFNTDQEYEANEALRASGETIQHNPLRTLMPGKHSLKQLVNAAATQKDALEESWAAGRRNKKEAGSRYGF